MCYGGLQSCVSYCPIWLPPVDVSFHGIFHFEALVSSSIKSKRITDFRHLTVLLTYLLSQSLLCGLSGSKLRLAILVNTVYANSCGWIRVNLIWVVVLRLLRSTITLVIWMWYLFYLFKSCVLPLSIQRTLIASFVLFVISWVRTRIYVWKCFTWMRSLVQVYMLLGGIFLSGVVYILRWTWTSRALSHVLLWLIKLRSSQIRSLGSSRSVRIDMIWWLVRDLTTLAKSHRDITMCMLRMGMSLTSSHSIIFSALVDDPLVYGIVWYFWLRDYLLPVLLGHLNWLTWAWHCLWASSWSILAHYVSSICIHLLWWGRSRILLLVRLSY